MRSVNIRALNAPLGTYTIFLDNRSIMTSRIGGGFLDVNMGGPLGPMFTVNVIPEPATTGLFVIGGAGLIAVWRRRRAVE
ncbi:MAG: PEP-CTERM sorting domain-containing protein [Chthoniobacterales bacterium]|nr:PEP-CTERM sorting domain-containing protein [Chthoniobacterales bacterium]